MGDNEIHLTENGTITKWRVDGVDVIYPERQVGNEMRGGITACVPMFSVQQRPVEGADLPLHGLLMYSHDADVTFDTASNTWTLTKQFPPSERFAWDFLVSVAVTLHESELRHTLTVKRSDKCLNPNEMPLSLGFHPYFATYGADFSFEISGKKYTKETLPKNIIDSDFAPLAAGQAAQLQTCKGTVAITPEGYDEYCLWSDNIEKYFCIEPIYQYREFGLSGTGLIPGASHTARCTLAFSR